MTSWQQNCCLVVPSKEEGWKQPVAPGSRFRLCADSMDHLLGADVQRVVPAPSKGAFHFWGLCRARCPCRQKSDPACCGGTTGSGPRQPIDDFSSATYVESAPAELLLMNSNVEGALNAL